jgi:membrane protease YdiL (CAAX protease family)
MSTPEIFPPATPAESVPAQAPNPVFRGSNGIRAGWRALLFVAIVGALLTLVSIVAVVLFHGRLNPMNQLTPGGVALSEGVIFLLTAIPALIMSRIEHRKFGQYGLLLQDAFQTHFWTGTLAGFLAISGCLFGILIFRGFHLTGLAIHGVTIIPAMVKWGLAFTLVGLAEEFAFRGYLQYTLTTGMTFWPAAVLLSALFGFAHASNPGESKAGLLSVVLFGLLFCLFLRRTGNLWWPVGFHAGWDWGQTFFYGVPDSGVAPTNNFFNSSFNGPAWLTGGTVGPEASVFAPIVLIVVAIWFTRRYRETRYQPS